MSVQMPAERLGNFKPYPLCLRKFLHGERKFRNIDERFAYQHDDAEKDGCLQRVPIVELDAPPKIVGDKNALRPDHVADDVHPARQPYGGDKRRDDEGAV